MKVRRDILVALVFAAALAGWSVIEASGVGDAGLLYLAPALLLALPLLFGRYVGEDRIAALTAAPPRARRLTALTLGLPRPAARVMHRGGRLVGSSLAKRPPPAPIAISPL